MVCICTCGIFVLQGGEKTPAPTPYTSDDLNWTVDGSRVSREHNDEDLRDVPLTTTEAENWDEYDTVFLGYPIWWGIAAWLVNNFVTGHDFSGKTVIPFAAPPPPAWGRAALCSPKWREAALGRAAGVSPPARPAASSAIGPQDRVWISKVKLRI